MRRCEKGHYYDEKKYSSCPYCGVNLTTTSKKHRKAKNEGVTVAKGFGDKRPDDEIRDAKTMMKLADDERKTVGVFSDELGIDPVVGWLVCTEGPEKGRDYRLHQGRNYLGRSAKMDISIFEDDRISRKNHASIVYDDRANEFFLVREEGVGITVNDEPLGRQRILVNDDVIEAGKSKFVFIAYCKGNVKW